MTIIYLAWAQSGHETLAKHVGDEPVDLLVSYLELNLFLNKRSQYNVRRWCLDSGAYSAWNSGKEINVRNFTARALDTDADEVFGLDVIGDAELTKRNLAYSWEQGLPAIPTFHQQDPHDFLWWCKDNAQGNKIAIGGIARASIPRRIRWARACLQRVWPMKVHGFACTAQDILYAVPFHSVDSTSWVYAPSAKGEWAGYSGRQQPVGVRTFRDYWVEVREHQKRAAKAAYIWRRELAELEQLQPKEASKP